MLCSASGQSTCLLELVLGKDNGQVSFEGVRGKVLDGFRRASSGPYTANCLVNYIETNSSVNFAENYTDLFGWPTNLRVHGLLCAIMVRNRRPRAKRNVKHWEVPIGIETC